MATHRSGTHSSQAGDAEDTKGNAAPIRIKKYANRRLYNTATSSYVTLEHLAQMVKDGHEFVVYDAKSGDDITRSVLTQIIVEEESKGGQNLLPIGFLRQLIGLYGDSMQWMVPKYLEHSLEKFAENQERMRQYMQNSMSGMFPFGSMEDMSRQNMAMFDQAMKMFSPFGPMGGMPRQGPGGGDRGEDNKGGGDTDAGDKGAGAQAAGTGARPSESRSEDPMAEMQRRLDALQQQMEALGQLNDAVTGDQADEDERRAPSKGGGTDGNGPSTKRNR